MRAAISLFIILVFASGCGEPVLPAAAQINFDMTQTATHVVSVALPSLTPIPPTPTLLPTPTLQNTKTLAPTKTTRPTVRPSPTSTPKASSTPTQTPSPTQTPTRTATPIAACSERKPHNNLLAIVTREYGLSRQYEPLDLVPLYEHFSTRITLGYDTQVRTILIEPLKQLIEDMHSAELHPTVISGYRSYSAQHIAWEKWKKEVGERALLLSARPGTSEHQLGTTVDFGSPELNNEFHTMFYATSEGEWLLANAHNYGFTLSYPRDAQAITQFTYEPWHYRYVGVELATELFEAGLSLTEYQLETMPPPCISGI